ncbi:MAG: hypothetical protein ABIE03_02100 [Patescibacteria group bacterium]|nr:hypothetical protein [Patescibacteria group bacterium]
MINKAKTKIEVYMLLITSVIFVFHLFSAQNNSEILAQTSFTPINQKVMTIFYDGISTSPIKDIDILTSEVKSDLEEASRFHGYNNSSARKEISFEIVEKHHVLGNTPQNNGKADYNEIIDMFNICQKVNDGTIDEIWVWADDNGNLGEASIAGPANRIFNINGSVIKREDCNKPVVIMGFNYEREAKEAVHDFGHRMERTIPKLVDGKSLFDVKQGDTWYEFDGNGYPSSCTPVTIKGMQVNSCNVNGLGYCGNVHFTPFSKIDYSGYLDTGESGLSDCENWNPQHSNPKIKIDCTKWNCNALGHLTWWFQNMPGRCSGISQLNGKSMPNWWWLFLKFDQPEPDWGCPAAQQPTPQPTPTPSLEEVCDGRDNTNNNIVDENLEDICYAGKH